MEVKKFQDSRNKELDSFKKEYNFLKSEYSRELASAINEKDPSQQQALTDRVQQINTQLVGELHSIIDRLNKGSNSFSSKELDDLTNELIQYQKDYADIEKSKDRVHTLKIIQAGNIERLQSAEYIYYIYLAILIILSFYIGYLILTTSIIRQIGGSFTKMKAPR
jgi:hypothetical protein